MINIIINHVICSGILIVLELLYLLYLVCMEMMEKMCGE